MKKIITSCLILVLALFINGCGKAEIKPDCSMAGSGQLTCNFRNIGNAKGTACFKVAMTNSIDENTLAGLGLLNKFELANLDFITDNIDYYVSLIHDMVLKNGKKFVDASQTERDEYLKFWTSRKIIKKMTISKTEICSGVIGEADTRQSSALILFGKSMTPVDLCSDGKKWSDHCSFSLISKEEYVNFMRPVPN